MTTVTRDHLNEALRSALEANANPAMAAADWLARDVDPTHTSAVSLLTDPDVSLANLNSAKSAYKTMRIVGETSADRQVGAHLYAATIAAALVHHRRRISRQSNNALRRGLQSLVADGRIPESLRELAARALTRIGDRE